MESPGNSVRRIADLRVDPSLDEIYKDGAVIKLEPRAMRLLMCLADRAGQVVSVDQLLDLVWKDVVVSPDSVYAAVAALRRMLNDDPRNPTYIANVVRRGYRLIAPVSTERSEPPLPGKPSIAVMPLVDLSNDPGQAYFVDGLMEEIVGALTRIRTIFVIGSGSSRSLKGQDLTPSDAARRLGVRYVLEGSVRRAGERIRIAVQLIDTSSGAQIWSQRFDGVLQDVFELQDNVALGVAGALEFSVQNIEALRAKNRPTSDLVSYDLYLRALVPFRTYTREGINEALELLERALALDPDYALALSLAGSCHAIVRQYQWTEDPGLHGLRAMQMMERSLRSGSDDPQVLGTAALAYWVAGETTIAAQLAERGATLNPGSSFPLLARGQVCIVTGDLENAEQYLQQSMRLDPLSPNRNLQLGALAALRFAQHRFAEAAELSRESSQLSLSPTSIGFMASAYGHLHQFGAARDALARLQSLTLMTPAELAALFYQKPEHRELFIKGIESIERPSQATAPA
jgi:TolB-like protein